MNGIRLIVHQIFVELEKLNHDSSMALRSWQQRPVTEQRREIKDMYEALKREIWGREQETRAKGGKHSPSSGAFGGTGQKGKGKGMKRQHRFMDFSLEQLRAEKKEVGERLDQMTYDLQEGKLTTGVTMVRPYRILPMFVGVLITGFEGVWINQDSCWTCGDPNDTARCCRCQCGICETCGQLLARASRNEHGDYLGASMASCSNVLQCNERQRQILNHWKAQTGEELA